MLLELEGKLKAVLPPRSGNSARGPWISQDFVVEYQDGNYPADAMFSAFGQDRVDELARYQIGDGLKISFNIKAREYSGRWYNDLRVWRISAPQAAAPQAAPQPAQPQAPAPAAPAPSYGAPAPSIDDMPIDLGVGNPEDDLPF